jgi:hypothetical protein
VNGQPDTLTRIRHLGWRLAIHEERAEEIAKRIDDLSQQAEHEGISGEEVETAIRGPAPRWARA